MIESPLACEVRVTRDEYSLVKVRERFTRVGGFLSTILALLLTGYVNLNDSFFVTASETVCAACLDQCLSEDALSETSFRRRSKPVRVGDKSAIASAALITGAGYSGTGFVSQVFRDVGVDIGHETFGVNGSSNWLASSPQFPIRSIEVFTNTFLIVRHPLQVIRSCRGTKWQFDTNFNSEMAGKDIRRDFEVNISVFNSLRHDVQCLEWWTTYTNLGYEAAECWFKIEDANDSKLFEMLCARSHLIGCEDLDFKGAIERRKNHNAHAGKRAPLVTWPELEFAATHDEMEVIERARNLCKLFFVNC